MQVEHDEREISPDSEHSESFMIECESCGSSVSSVSLHDLDDSFRSYYSSVASAASATSLGADCDYDGEDDDEDDDEDDTSLAEEDLRDIMNKFVSNRSTEKDNKKNPNLGFGESNAAIIFDLRSKRPRNRLQRSGGRRRRPGTKAPAQRSASPRSSLRKLEAQSPKLLHQRPSFHKRPSMSELVAQDMLLCEDAITTGDESEDSSSQEDTSWHIRQHQPPSTTRGSRKEIAVYVDDDVDVDDDDNEDNWSVSLRDHTRSSPHASTKQASSSAWPNLCRNNLTDEQRELGITDHGTIHLDSDSDGGSSSMADSMCSDSSASTSFEYNSGSESSSSESSEESAFEESSYMEQSVTIHTTASSRAPQSPTMRSQQPFRQAVAGMLPLEEAPTMEESLRSTLLSEHSRISRSTSKRLSEKSESSREVTAKRNQVRSKLQQLDAHMLKVFGQSSTTPEISQATRNSLREQLTSPKKKNDKFRASDLSYRSASQSMTSQSKSYHSNKGWLKSSNSQSTTSLLTQSRVSSSSNQGVNQNSLMMSPNHSKSTSSLLATKRSNADLKRQQLREAFSSHLGMSSSRLSSQSLRSRD